MGNKPHKERAFGGSPSLPDFLPRSKNSCPREETLISCLRRVLPISWKPPYVFIFHFRLQLEVRQNISQPKVVYENSNRKTTLNIRNLSMVDKSFLYYSLLASSYWDSNHKARRRVHQVLWAGILWAKQSRNAPRVLNSGLSKGILAEFCLLLWLPMLETQQPWRGKWAFQ